MGGAEGGALGLDTSRLAVGGDSAGGTLATVCATLARDAGLPLALQLLFYPGCAAWQASASHRRYHQGLVLEQAHIEYFFGQYIDDADREDWRFAPLNTPEVEGVAPAWFGLAECDPLADDGVQYADKLRAAGVAVQLEIYRGVTHEFIKMDRRSRKPSRRTRTRLRPSHRHGNEKEDFRFFHRLRVRWAEWTCRRSSSTPTT